MTRLVQFKAAPCSCPAHVVGKTWIVPDCRGCWYCLICRGMGYCYTNNPEHLDRFRDVERNNPYYKLAIYREFYEAVEADNIAVVDWCCEEVHHLTRTRLKAAAQRINPNRGFQEALDSWSEEKAARLEKLLDDNGRFWAQAHEEIKDVAGNDI